MEPKFFPTSPDLADILDDLDFDFDTGDVFDVLAFHISGFPSSKIIDFHRFQDSACFDFQNPGFSIVWTCFRPTHFIPGFMRRIALEEPAAQAAWLLEEHRYHQVSIK